MTDMKSISTEMKSHTGLSSFRLSCERTLYVNRLITYMFTGLLFTTEEQTSDNIFAVRFLRSLSPRDTKPPSLQLIQCCTLNLLPPRRFNEEGETAESL